MLLGNYFPLNMAMAADQGHHNLRIFAVSVRGGPNENNCRRADEVRRLAQFRLQTHNDVSAIVPTVAVTLRPSPGWATNPRLANGPGPAGTERGDVSAMCHDPRMIGV